MHTHQQPTSDRRAVASGCCQPDARRHGGLYGDRVILTERYWPSKARFSGKRNGDGDGP